MIERRNQPRRFGRRRELLALLTVAAAVLITGAAIPVLAARAARDEGAAIVPSLPILLPLAVLALAAALLALYRLAAGTTDAGPEPAAGPTGGAPRGGGRTAETAPAAEASPLEPQVTRTAEEPAVSVKDRRPATAIQDPAPPRESPPAGAPATGDVKARRSAQAPRDVPRRERPAPARERSPEPLVETPTPLEDGETVEQTCEIVWWHGARKGGFEARTTGAGGTTRVVERSQMIAWAATTPPPPEQAPLAAHERLLARLQAAGWELDEPGDEWYAARLRRSVAAPRPRRRGARGTRERPARPPR